MRLITLIAVFAAFTLWSLTVAIGHGPLGFITNALEHPWGMQVLIDLSIALFVAWSWLRHDARERGIPAWPYILGTLTLGSIGVLAYLIHRELRGKASPTAVTPGLAATAAR
jgi:hypothetical protein